MALKTKTEIAQELGIPPHRVAYALTSRCIKPSKVAGSTCLYDEAGIRAVKAALEETTATAGMRGRPGYTIR